jgi:septal ring factor EnvC (AmiA/AmiB activator)
MMKAGYLLFGVCVLSGAARADQADACAGMEGSALTQCRINQQTLRQQALEQQLQAQQQRQSELDRQQREVQQQLEAMRQENASLRQQMEREAANQAANQTANQAAIQAANQAAMQAVNQAARARTADSTAMVTRQDLRNWKAENPWFGSDYVRTQYAMHYTKQLQKEQPELTGRALLDAVSAKVNQQFAARP